MRRVAGLALLGLLLCLGGCGGGELARTGPGAVPAGKVSTSSRDAAEAARLISAYRQSRGLAPVVTDGGLNEAAAFQARAVAEAGQLSHGAFTARMIQFGVPGFSAENLSAGSGAVADAIARWKRSPGHDENLLMPQARRIGLARADSPGHGYGHYWALVLAQ